MVLAAAGGVWGLNGYPLPRDNVFLQIVALRDPIVFRGALYGYAALWFSTAFLAANVLLSALTIVVYRRAPSLRTARAATVSHRRRRDRVRPSSWARRISVRCPDVRPTPSGSSIPQRGLYTGVMILGAVGTGKTSACMYPYVEQLLRWRAQDPAQKVGGLVLEVKGDFCKQVRGMLGRAGREDDYLEIGLDTGVCYNPLHNDLDPYAVAYAVATLLNNLFGRSKEPFWQQAYTDLLKFVISLRRISDGYTTLSEVYRYIIDERQIDQNIRALEGTVSRSAGSARRLPRRLPARRAAGRRGRCGRSSDRTRMAHPYDAELEGYLVARTTFPSRCARAPTRSARIAGTDSKRSSAGSTDRGRSSISKVKASIVEGVVVFLSLFDENPEVYRAFCPPATAYAQPPQPGEPRPLPPLEELLETGHVLGLNFPVALNPALARGLGVMLKLDFQRAVLNRIPKISANPTAAWRDILFVADEYHAFATVGETDPTGDERAFALSRQARLIPIVATQSISSLRSALAGDEGWRTLLQCFRTKLFLATSDEFTAKVAAELCGRRDRLKARYTIAEAGANAHISLLERPADGVAAHASARARRTRSNRTTCFSPACSWNCRTRRPSRCRTTAQSVAAAVLLPEAALPGRADQLLRPPGAGGAMSSLDRILPFLRPIEDLLRDPGRDRGDGQRRAAGACSSSETARWRPSPSARSKSRNLTVAIKNIARACGDEISDAQPMLDARLEDGSRVAAMFPPCAVDRAGPDDPEVHAPLQPGRARRRRRADAGAWRAPRRRPWPSRRTC